MKTINHTKTTKNLHRSLKAISPVIATLLMISIVVVASLVTYAWVTGYMNFQTSKVGNAVEIPSLALSNDGLHVYVQNVGQGTVEVGAVYVDGAQKAFTAPGGSTQIPEGRTIELLVEGNYDSTQRYDLKVTTTGGTSMSVIGKPGAGTVGSVTPGNNAPVIDSFTPADITPLVVEGGDLVFSVAASDADVGDTLTYAWYLDSVLQASTASSFTYGPASGTTHTVSVDVSDGTDITPQSWTITVNAAPIADFTHLATYLVVDFTDASTDSDGTIVSWSWNFGDTGTSTAQNPSHTYAGSGTYDVTLTVTDDNGATDDHSIPVSVSAAPQTVTRSPSSSSGSWSNENNAYADGGNSATSDSDNEQSTWSGYGFTVPTDATVTQVRVRLDAWNSYNDAVRLDVYDGSSWHTYSPNPIILTSSQTTIWCDVTSLASWTASDVNSIQVRLTHDTVNMNENIYLDWVPIEVTYTP